ncbi:MAG: type pilus assembly protein PilA [Acidimicrobiaceae bacterium]
MGSAAETVERVRRADARGAADGESCSGSAGFTLVELLIVLLIIGVLLAIAVPSLLTFAGRAERAAARANVAAARPAIEAYFVDNGSYNAGMSLAKLKASYAAGIKLSAEPIIVSGTTYCIQSTVGGKTAHMTGPAGPGGITMSGSC